MCRQRALGTSLQPVIRGWLYSAHRQRQLKDLELEAASEKAEDPKSQHVEND
jgi:hypothetical protein